VVLWTVDLEPAGGIGTVTAFLVGFTQSVRVAAACFSPGSSDRIVSGAMI